MRCLSPVEVEAIFTSPKFTVSLVHQDYRSALILAPALASRQTRVAARLPQEIDRTAYFIGTLNRWLPSNHTRLLWIDHWETGLYGGHENAIVSAAWRGLGETRSLTEAPGLLLEAQDWEQEDQLEIPPAQAETSALLTGVIAMLMITQSDGWLIAGDCADRIEFWEGHFFFHSQVPAQIDRANNIVDEFGCERWQD